MTDNPAFPPCIDCGDPDSGTAIDGRCRECEIDWLFAAGSCRECLSFIIRPDYALPIEQQHRDGCNLRDDPNYTGRNDAEIASIRDRRAKE